MVKSMLANAGDARDAGSVSRSERSPGGGNGNMGSSILSCKVPWTEEPGELQSMRYKELGTIE